MSGPGDSFVAQLTPLGRSAIATVIIGGERIDEVLDRCFQAASGRTADSFKMGQIVYGKWKEAQGQPVVGEDLVVCRTASHRLEIHCHGGVAAPRAVVQSITEMGIPEIPWQDSVLATHSDPWIAAAHVALADAPTERTGKFLLAATQGNTAKAIARVDKALELNDIDQARRDLQPMLDWESFGRHLTQPHRVVIAGPPNAGKSSLLNRILGFGRAIVFERPGTTRDVVTEYTAIDGWPVALSDTAGIRETADHLEEAGIRRASEVANAAELLLVVHDVTQPWTPAQEALCVRDVESVIVYNKCDLGSGPFERAGVEVSAVTGAGLGELLDAIALRLVPRVPKLSQPLLLCEWQRDAVRESLKRIDAGDVAAARRALTPDKLL